MLGAWLILHATESLLSARFAAALARCLAASGKRVLLFDLSPDTPALDVFLGVDGRVVYTLSDVGKVSPSDVMLTPSEHLFFVPLGVGESIYAEKISACIEDVKPDAVLLSATRQTLSLARALSDGAILLTDASPIALRAAGALAEIEHFDGFLLSDFCPRREEIEKMPSLTGMADLLGIPLLGILPQTDLYNTHTVKEKDFLTAIENIAGRFVGENVSLLRGISLDGVRKARFFTGISE